MYTVFVLMLCTGAFIFFIPAPDAARTQRFLSQISMDTATVMFCGTSFKNINPTYYK